MLTFFRRGITAKIMLGVLAIGLFAIVITGFGTGGMGLGDLGGLRGSTVATVEGHRITTTELTDEANRQLAGMRRQQPELDMANFLRRGALEQIADQMVTIAATVAFAREQGLAVSKRMIDREIASVPAFQNLAGQFDQATFLRAIAQERMTEEQLREDIANRLIQRQLILPAAGSAHVPQGLAHQYASLLLESRTGIVGGVPTEAMGPGAEPSDQEVAKFYSENVGRYTIPERRVLRYARFGPANVAAQAKATEAEIAAAYASNPEYAARETRRLSQVILPDEAAARGLAQRIAGGMSFAQAAQQAGFAPSDTAVGEQTKEAYARLSSPAVANAAFAAARGAVAGPIRSELGWHVVRVEDVRMAAGRPLAAVRGALAAAIERQKAQNLVADLAGRIENGVGEGLSFGEIVQRERLEARDTVPVTATGAAPGNPGWQAPPEVAPLLDAGFELEPNDEPVVEPLGETGDYALLAVTQVIPAAPPPLAQIRARVKGDLIARRALERARAVATAIVSKINAGTPPAQAFAEAQVRLPPTETITATRRDVARQSGQVPPPLAMLFSLPRGKARLLAAPNGRGWFIVYLDKVVPGDANKEPGLVEAVRGEFARVLGDEYGGQFTRAIRAAADVKRNEGALRRLKRELMGAGSAVQ
jgi:peptidyl-prolyl cis-trans isomerase D